MKKALVYYLYGTKNAGDMAICVGAVELLKQQGYEITMVSRFSEAEEEYQRSKNYIQSYYPDVQVYPGPFSFERNFSAVKKLMAYGASFAKVCGVISDEQNLSLIQKHDVVFFNGGNLLRGEKLNDYLRLIALFYPVQLAKKAGKPIYSLPQSTAGISCIGERLLKGYLKGIRKIYIREKISYEALSKRFPDLDFHLSTDLAFFCTDREEAFLRFDKQFPEISGTGHVALILRSSGIGDIGRLNEGTEALLLDRLKDYVLDHPEQTYWIVLQTLKDREISQRFLDSVSGQVSISMVESHDPLALRELYSRMDFTITMRLHAGILSLSALTPVVGLFSSCWGLKNPGIMASYDMPYQIVEEQSVPLDHLVRQIHPDAHNSILKTIHSFRDSILFN